MSPHLLKLNCPDAVGLLARVTGFIAASGGNLLDVSQYTDTTSRWFFARLAFTGGQIESAPGAFRAELEKLAGEMSAEWTLRPADRPVRTVILVSKEDHCLVDLLWRWRSKELNIEIPAIISNHETLRGFVEWHGIPFHYVPVTPDNKPEAYARIGQLFKEADADVMVLARYMQILSPDLCASFPGRIINIHHSFLPSFVGAKPYHQAWERGVKLIGATCHYVTADLDQGPIIEQDVIRIDHSDSVDDMVRYGKDIEKTVLARGLRNHLEGRVLVHGNKTIVFR